MIRKTIYFLLFTIFSYGLHAQADSSSWQQKLANFKIKPVVGFQLWNTYTMGMKVYEPLTQTYQDADNRFNTSIRRIRVGAKGEPYENLQFTVVAALDFIGKDALTAIEGALANQPTPRLGVWDAFVQWRMSPENESANLVVGWFTPIIGRESISSAFRSPSFEKGWSQNYLRRQLVGSGPGRAGGVNLGGLIGEGNASFGYDIGIFNTTYQDFARNSTGLQWSPLLVGRAVLYLGDPELKSYSIGHKFNYFGKRNGISIAIAGATQGETAIFSSNHALGVDFLWNFKNLNMDGEWTRMWREDIILGNSPMLKSDVGYIRLGYNIDLEKNYVLEPVITYIQFSGEMNKLRQERAANANMTAGEDRYLDLGLNFYFNPDLKLNLHYTLRNGDAGDAGDGFAGNNYFNQGSVGAIQRGDLLGLGFVGIF